MRSSTAQRAAQGFALSAGSRVARGAWLRLVWLALAANVHQRRAEKELERQEAFQKQQVLSTSWVDGRRATDAYHTSPRLCPPHRTDPERHDMPRTQELKMQHKLVASEDQLRRQEAEAKQRQTELERKWHRELQASS